MPVWWGCFAYAMIVSIIGMYMYKSKKQSATLVPVEGEKTEQYRSIGLFFALASFALLVFFVGNRTSIHDTAEYQNMYEIFYSDDLNQINNIIQGKSANEKGPLFFIYLVLFKHFTHGTFNDWLFSIAIFQCVSLAIFLYRYSINFAYSVFLYYMTSGFIWLVNGMRQFLAIALILFFVKWFFERKTIPFLIVIVLATFIHSASILWIFVYFIANFRAWSTKFLVSVVIFSLGIYLLSISSILQDTEYAYLTKDTFSGINPFRILVNAVPALLAFIRRKEIDTDKKPMINILINISVICFFCYVVGGFTNGVIARIAAYFNPFTYIFLPWLLKNAFDESMEKTITLISLIGYILYFCYEMYVAGNGIYFSVPLNLDYLVV